MSNCPKCGRELTQKEACDCSWAQPGFAPSSTNAPAHAYVNVKTDWKYMVLESRKTGKRFFSDNSGRYEDDWYKLIGLTDTVYDAQTLCDIPRHARARKGA
jgi:hypothetical protein